MSLGLSLREELSHDLRGEVRYAAFGSIYMLLDGKPIGTGTLIDISASGAGIKFFGILQVGTDYKIDIGGLDILNCTVVRNTSATYGLKFNLTYTQDKQLRARLAKLFQDGAICE